MKLIQKLTIDLAHRSRIPTVDAIQGDTARALEISLMNGIHPWEIPYGAAIVIHYRCCDGSGGIYDTLPNGDSAFAVGGNTVTVQLAPQVCAVPGTTQLQVTVIHDGKQLSTFSIDLLVAGEVNASIRQQDYTNLSDWWNQQGGAGLPTGGTPGQGLLLDDQGYAHWTHLAPEDVGLSNVDNTPDAEKPVSGPQQEALQELNNQLQEAIADMASQQQEYTDTASATNREYTDDKVDSLVQSGIWTPVLISGANSLTGFSGCTYHKTGNLVHVGVTCWGTFSGRNSNGIILSLPFSVGSVRAYGAFGYNNSGLADLYVYAGGGTSQCEIKQHNASGQETAVTGTGIGRDAWTFQFALTYATND